VYAPVALDERCITAHLLNERVRGQVVGAAAATACQPACTGTTCPAGTPQCVDDDCVGRWTQCSVTCGGGPQARSRSVLTPAAAGAGRACAALAESADCNTNGCDECTGCVGKSAGPCQNTANGVCPAGTTACTVKGTTLGLVGGAPGDVMCDGCFCKSAGPCRHVKDTSCYGFMWGTTTCPPGTAPVDCQVGAWSKLGTCAAHCGGSSQDVAVGHAGHVRGGARDGDAAVEALHVLAASLARHARGHAVPGCTNQAAGHVSRHRQAPRFRHRLNML